MRLSRHSAHVITLLRAARPRTRPVARNGRQPATSIFQSKGVARLELSGSRGKISYCKFHTRVSVGFAASTGADGADLSQDGGNIVSVSVEGMFGDHRLEETITAEVEEDASKLLQCIQSRNDSGPMELSLVLCDDIHISELNQSFRGVSGPTDVLSFELESPPGYPLQLLGDIVISVDTAKSQAEERGHTLRDECRVLLVHGLLHLFGHDHEKGEEDAKEMAALEQQLLASLGWEGKGLIACAQTDEDLHSGQKVDAAASTSDDDSALSDDSVLRAPGAAAQRRKLGPGVKLLALDMDGTLLDSRSKVLPSSVEALKAALAAGTRVCLATGKARPAAIAAMAKVGLAGEGLVISTRGPGLFLQGLAVHGGDGRLLEGPDLPAEVVRAAFEYAQDQQLALAAFLGDRCATLQMHPELEELHHRYYEPMCEVMDSIDAMLAGPPVKKLLLMTDADSIAQRHQPHWSAAAKAMGADTTMAVPNMLEILPAGINKWVGMQLLMADLALTKDQVMACGDGANDLQLVENCGLGIAMGNAVPEVKAAADYVVASNDEHGIAEAVERFIL